MTMTETLLTHQSPKLGDVPYTTEDVVRFPQGLPGFERLREFLLVTRDECAPFVFLASLEKPDVALPLLPLALAAGNGAFPRESLGRLGSDETNTLAYYAVVSIGVDAKQIITNLRAPVVVNLDTRLGCQVILPDETLSLAAPLPA